MWVDAFRGGWAASTVKSKWKTRKQARNTVSKTGMATLLFFFFLLGIFHRSIVEYEILLFFTFRIQGNIKPNLHEFDQSSNPFFIPQLNWKIKILWKYFPLIILITFKKNTALNDFHYVKACLKSSTLEICVFESLLKIFPYFFAR